MMAAESHAVPKTPEKPRKKRESTILDDFNKLGHNQDKLRIKSACELLRKLAENGESEKGENEAKYALGRLVRGLGASKVQTRIGYFTTLVALLNTHSAGAESLFEAVEKELHKGGGNTKSENADVCLGRVLVSGAIIRSDLYKNLPDADKEKVLQLLIKSGKERSYLGLASYSFIIDLYSKIDKDEFERVVFHQIKGEIGQLWKDQNLDTLYLLLETVTTFPDSVKSKFLKNSLGTSDIITEDNLRHIADVLMGLPRVTSLNHPVYELVLGKIDQSGLTVQFFDQLDAHLVRSNRNKYFVVVKLLTSALSRSTTRAHNLLGKNFLQQTLSTFKTAVGKNKDKDFQAMAQKLFETLLDNLKKSDKDKVKLEVLRKLLFYPGTFIFEKITRSKIVQNITSLLTNKGVAKLAEIYKGVILATTDRVVNDNASDKWWNSDRVYASHLLIKLVNRHDDLDWKVEQMKFLMNLALLPSDAVGGELADSLRDCFYASLDLKIHKLEDLRHVLSELVEALHENLKQVRIELSQAELEAWHKAHDICVKIRDKKKNAVFHVLFAHLALQLFNAKHNQLAVDSLNELFSCYERVKAIKKQKGDSDDPMWIEVVVDLFLNLLSHNSHLLRSVIGHVFPHLCSQLNATAIHQILTVLDPTSGDNPLHDESETEDDDDDDEKDEDEESESEASIEEDEEEGEESDDHGNEQLKLALHGVLSTVGDGDSDLDVDTLDDETGGKLDEALAEAFKQFKPTLGANRKQGKKQSKDDQTLTHFRVRVLDLIEIYLGNGPTMLLALEIMLPLLQSFEFSIRDDHQKPLQERLKSCLKKLSALKKFDSCEGVTEELLVTLLQSLVEKGTKNATILQDMGEKIAECCTFIINCSTQTGSSGKVSKVIKQCLDLFFIKRDCLIPYVLFKSVLQLNWTGLVDLVPILFDSVFAPTVRPFRRTQAVELLRYFYSNHRFLTTHKELLSSTTSSHCAFLDSCIAFLDQFCANPVETKVREKFICNLFLLVNQIRSSGREYTNWGALGQSARDCRSYLVLSTDTKQAFNKLCKSLGVSNVVAMKAKPIRLSALGEVKEEDEEGVGKTKTKAKKRKTEGDDGMKLKKQSKELRLSSLSEGLEGGAKRKFEFGQEVEEEEVQEQQVNGDGKKHKRRRKKSKGDL